MIRYILIASAGVAMAVSGISGFFIIPYLKKLKFSQTIYEEGPKWHGAKQGTPTMGGFMFILGTLASLCIGFGVIFFTNDEFLKESITASFGKLLILVIFSLAFGFVGFMDDYIKVVKKRNLGFKARYKILLQIFITTMFLASLFLENSLETALYLPFIGEVELGSFYYFFSFVTIIGFVNAVNLTDGIDGLATSITFIVMLGFTVSAIMLNMFAASLFTSAVSGALVGFLAWNFYPAKTFMGDTGSMFLGGAVVCSAYILKRPEIIFLIGVVYLIEAFSVILQVSYFKATKGKRIFKMSPLHHHFELCGYSEIKIVILFSAVTALGAIATLCYLYIF